MSFHFVKSPGDLPEPNIHAEYLLEKGAVAHSEGLGVVPHPWQRKGGKGAASASIQWTLRLVLLSVCRMKDKAAVFPAGTAAPLLSFSIAGKSEEGGCGGSRALSSRCTA